MKKIFDGRKVIFDHAARARFFVYVEYVLQQENQGERGLIFPLISSTTSSNGSSSRNTRSNGLISSGDGDGTGNYLFNWTNNEAEIMSGIEEEGQREERTDDEEVCDM